MLLDAASLYFRAFYGVPTSVTAPDGRPVNAVRGFLDMTARLVTTHSPDRFVACWDDDWRPAFRVAALPSYKAHRLAADGGEETPDELGPQVPVLVEVLAAAALIREFGDLAGIRAAAARTVVPRPPLTAAVLRRLHAAGDYLDAAPVVVAVERGIDLPPVEGTLPRSPADPAALAALADRHGLRPPPERPGAALGWPAGVLDAG